MSKLPTYDPDAKCPKCGHETVLTIYQRPRKWSEYIYAGDCQNRSEHLNRPQ